MPWTVGDVDKHKKGLTEEKKKQWVKTANSVLAECIADGGTDETCAPKAIRIANGVTNNVDALDVDIQFPSGLYNAYTAYRTVQDNSYNIRTEIHQGRKCIVVPVVMMVEGVHRGSRGALFHPSEELGKVPDCWNGIPITVQHPEENGSLVSANQPHIIDKTVVGRVYHTQFADGKLKAEAWLDEEKLQQFSPVALGYIRSQKPLDVSVGVFTDDEMTEGLWNGEVYEAISRNHRPDHLALLPGGTGACSWADGCGIRANQQSGAEGGDNAVTIEEALKLLKDNGMAVHSVQVNGEMGLRDRLGSIQKKLDSMDTLQKAHYLQEVFDNYVIYEVAARGGDVPNSNGSLYKQNYSINNDGEVEFSGDPIEVKKEVKYVAMQQGQTIVNNSSQGAQTMPDNKKCCPEKVQFLVQNENSPWKAEDQPWLESLEEVQVDKLVSQVKMVPEKDAGPKPITKEEAVQALSEHLSNPDKFLSIVPKEMAEQMRHGLALYKEVKQQHINTILANSDKFTSEELMDKSIEELSKLISLIPQPADYSLRSGGNLSAVQSADNLLLPPGIEATV